MPLLPRTVQLAQGALQRLNFTLIRVLLPLRHFQDFKHFLHVLKRSLQILDDLVHSLEGFAHACRRGLLAGKRRIHVRRRPHSFRGRLGDKGRFGCCGSWSFGLCFRPNLSHCFLVLGGGPGPRSGFPF